MSPPKFPEWVFLAECLLRSGALLRSFALLLLRGIIGGGAAAATILPLLRLKVISV